MYNRFLWVGGLFILTYLVTSLTFSKPTPNAPTPARTLPTLTSEEFKQTVKQMDAQTQSTLDQTLAKLLGSSSNPSALMTPASAPSRSTPTPAYATPPDTNTYISTPAPASSGGGLNPYIN